MKVLLTGASGFVGSHILDVLVERAIPTAILLRPTSNRQFVQRHLGCVEVQPGSINDLKSLEKALADATHVIHCAGCTKARRNSDFYEVNETGTRNMVAALNLRNGAIQQFLHISSLAVAGPATAERPATELDAPNPISEYGRSKLAAELEVRNHCRTVYTILRPPAVYGPRDSGFFAMFNAVHRHLLPRPNRRQILSLVYAKDLAQAVVNCLGHPGAAGKAYFVASRERVSASGMAQQIAGTMGGWTLPCPLPAAALWPVCLAQEIFGRLTGRAMLLNMQKYSELRAPGWVCEPSLFEKEIGFRCETPLKQGISEALEWYRKEGWLP